MASVRATSDRPTVSIPPGILRSVEALSLVVLSALLAVGVFWLDTRHNDFPSYDHPDERSKAEQLQTGDRNFRHPQLLLELTGRLAGPATPRTNAEWLVRQGRAVSAGCAAAVAVLAAWAGYAAAGRAGFVAGAIGLGLCPAVLTHAHYCKEDLALLAGVFATLAAGAAALRAASPGGKLWALIGLGVGCGLAASGKYCGVVMLGPALVVGVAAAWRHWGLVLAAPLLVVVFAGATWLAVDWRCVADWDGFLNGLTAETEHSTTEHSGLTMPRPNGYFAEQVRGEGMFHVELFATLAIPALVAQAVRGGRWGFGAWLVLTTGVYLVMLSYSVIPFYRYALPVTAMLHLWSSLGVVWLWRCLPRRIGPRVRAGVLVIAFAMIAMLQAVRCADYTGQFADDSRVALREWANRALPPGALVVSDGYAGYRSQGSEYMGPATARPGVRAFGPQFAADFGPTPAELARRGVGYIVTAGSSSERFASPYVIAFLGEEELLRRRRAFYDALHGYPVVWSRVAEHPMRSFTNPDIVVYRLQR